MHEDRVMLCCPFTVSLACDGPIPLDSEPGSVLGEKHLVDPDVQIGEFLEIVKYCALHVILHHMATWKNQFPFSHPIVCSNAKIAFFPRLRLTVHECADLSAVVLSGVHWSAH